MSKRDRNASKLEQRKLLAKAPGHVTMADRDASGLLYLGAVYRMAEAVLSTWLCGIGHSMGEIRAEGFGLPCVHSEADYLGPLAVDDHLLETRLYVTSVGRTSVGFLIEIYAQDDEHPRVIVRTRHLFGCMSPLTDLRSGFEPRAVPTWLLGPIT